MRSNFSDGGAARHLFRIIVLLMWCWLPSYSTTAFAAEKPPLRFCFSSNAMPRAGKTAQGAPQGVDLEVAKLLAAKLDRQSEFHWCANDSCRLQSLRSNRCDVVIGLAHESINAPDIGWAKTYAAAKFGLVVAAPEKQIRSLQELRGRRVGLVRGTVPLSAKNHTVVGFTSRESLLRGFHQAKLEAALVDADFTAWYLSQHPDLKLRLVDEFVSPYRWAIGIAVRANDTTLRGELSRAVESSLQHAEFPALFKKYGLVHRPPLVDSPKKAPKALHNTWQHVQETGNLVVSMDPANLPYSSADADKPGFDVEIARLLAKELGLRLDLQWIDIHRETAIGQLLEQECDLAFGASIDPDAMDDEEALAGRVIYSRPYYGTGYMLFAREGAAPVATLSDLQGERSRRMGTQAGTIADYSLRQNGYMRRLFGTQLGVLNALEKGDIDYAYMWPNFDWMLHNDPKIHAKSVAGFVPKDRWNIAVAMRQDDAELKQHVDQALERILKRGDIARTFKTYHMPHFAPFESPTDSNDSDSPIDSQTDKTGSVRQPLKRGREHQMSRRQRSRRQYNGLQSVRSRGTLVVGLDQNNLPYSKSHPKPSGIDYEIAQLLAEELEVSLEVYWAYSSHDSYPSKLANRRLCDVILGVMPDDRFAQRVVFSRPYYFAEYVYAVPAENQSTEQNKLLGDSPIAAEPGLAVRGLEGKQVQALVNLPSILAAISSGEVATGYVLSSRAHWLASEQWPGKLRFVTPKPSVDRFPICVAMRRNEADFTEAINSALDKLRQSGQLEQVFARWHIPFHAALQHTPAQP